MSYQAPNNANVRPMNGPAPANNGGGRQNWQPDAYVNMSMPVRRQDGSKGTTKIGAIELRMSKDVQAKVMAAFREDPEGAAERLRAAIQFDYREAGANEGAEVLF